MKTEGYIEGIDTFTLQWHQKEIENGGGGSRYIIRNCDKQKLKRGVVDLLLLDILTREKKGYGYFCLTLPKKWGWDGRGVEGGDRPLVLIPML